MMGKFRYLLKLKSSTGQNCVGPSLFGRKSRTVTDASAFPVNSRLLQIHSRTPYSSFAYAKHSHLSPLKHESSIAASTSCRSFCRGAYPEDATESDDEKSFEYYIEKGEGIIADDEWEEEDNAEPQIGDGGDGGGIVLHNVPWGERVLSIAREVVKQFGDDMLLFAFKTSPRGYIYVRLDKLSNEYGCPALEEIESFSRAYKKRLEEEGSKGEIPDDLALDVSSPGAERLLRVPDDLHRFKDFPMIVTYLEEDTGAKRQPQQRDRVFFLDSIEAESEHCSWKLADVKENRDPASKGRPMSRKRKDWRLSLPYNMHKKVTFYLEF